jgi:hypothetical protein
MKPYGSQLSDFSAANQPFNTVEDTVWDGSHPFKATVSSRGAQGPSVEIKDVIVKDESVSWESASAETRKDHV